MLVTAGLSLAALAVVSWLLWERPDGGRAYESFVRAYGYGGPGQVLEEVWRTLSDLGHGRFLVYLLLALGALCRDPERAQDSFAVVLAASFLCQVLKVLADRARPFDASPHAWPSGHATSATALALSLYRWPARWYRAALGLAVLIALSRLFHFRHWPSDVLSGAALACFTAAFLLGRRVVLPAAWRRSEAGLCFLALGVAYFLVDAFLHVRPPDLILPGGAFVLLGAAAHLLLPRGREAA